MNYLSNLTQIFSFFFIIISFVSCSDTDSVRKDDIVPYTLVNEQINLSYFYKISDVNLVGNSQYFQDFGGKYIGYRGHGIIVAIADDGYKAYDATCTYDVDVEEHLELDGLFAVCTLCDSKFNILTGWPFEGSVARYQLKKYRTYHNRAEKLLTIKN